MTTETFKDTYLFSLPVDVTIDIDNDGAIIKVCHEGTDEVIYMPPDLLARFEEHTAEKRRQIVAECEAEGREYEKHIQRESAYVRLV